MLVSVTQDIKLKNLPNQETVNHIQQRLSGFLQNSIRLNCLQTIAVVFRLGIVLAHFMPLLLFYTP